MMSQIILQCNRLYGMGKKVSLSKIQSSDELSKINEIFRQSQQASMDDITKAVRMHSSFSIMVIQVMT